MDPIANTPVPRRFSKAAIVVIAGLAAVLLLVLVLSPFGAAKELDNMNRGFAEGFDAHGTYALADQLPGQNNHLSLQVGNAGDHTGIWQLGFELDDRETRGGYFEASGDPNIYRLFDEDGTEAGWVHLAYANAKGEGIAYLDYGSNVLSLEKVDTVPTFFESGDLSEPGIH